MASPVLDLDDPQILIERPGTIQDRHRIGFAYRVGCVHPHPLPIAVAAIVKPSGCWSIERERAIQAIDDDLNRARIVVATAERNRRWATQTLRAENPPSLQKGRARRR